jgi:hypothetical protein
MGANQRDNERVPMLGDLRGEIMVYQGMLVREIASGGASIETSTPLQLNSLHSIRLTLGDTAVIVQGRVVHSRISEVDQDVVTYRSGVEFVEASERVREAIDAFLAVVKAERGGG